MCFYIAENKICFGALSAAFGNLNIFSMYCTHLVDYENNHNHWQAYWQAMRDFK